MKHKRHLIKPAALSLAALLGCGALSFTPRLQAQALPAPALMNFQGRLAHPDGTPVADGDTLIRFSLWDAETGGTEKWNQSGNVTVANGVFDILLSVGTPRLFDGNLWMEIQIGTDASLAPRQQLVSAAYAMKANSVPDGSIGATQIAAGSIPADKLVAGTLNPVAWQLTGNSNTVSQSGFLGTIDKQPLIFRTFNSERMRVDYDGRVGVGTSTPSALLDVNGPVKAANFIGSGAQLTALPPNTALLNIDQTFSGAMSFGGGLKVNGATTVEFGAGVAGKEVNAGKIGYQVFTSDALDIVGAGAPASNRKIRFWSEGGASFAGPVSTVGSATVGYLAVNPQAPGGSEGGEILLRGAGGANNPDWVIDAFMTYVRFITVGQVKLQVDSAGNAAFAGNINAPSATIPTLNGNVSVNGEMTARVVTVTGGSDVAEPYHVANAGDVKPIAGMVVGIDPDQIGQMRVSTRAYDKTVAGILSGANGISPGITLRQTGTLADGTLPVAAIGRVWCYCDAEANGSIEAGDMLTTSDTPGHAMKVNDFDRANGAIIGKAMSPLKSGRELVLVFVSLK